VDVAQSELEYRDRLVGGDGEASLSLLPASLKDFWRRVARDPRYLPFHVRAFLAFWLL